MKKQQVSVVNGVLTVEYPTIGKSFKADLSQYSDAVRGFALIHGFKQKFGDAASGGTPAEKFQMVQRIHESLLNGEWELTATPDHSTIVLEAICNLKKLKLDKVQKVATPEKIKEWASNVRVKAEIARIRATRAAKVADEAEEDDVEIEL